MSDRAISLRYVGPHEQVEVEAHDGSRHYVDRNEVKEFPPDVAKSLLEQSIWEPANLKVSDGARELATERGVNLTDITPKRGKSITKEDVEAHLAELEDEPPADQVPDAPAESAGEEKE